MIDELVSRVFATRNAAHLAHFAARGKGSFSAHMALGEFYDAIIDKTDEIVEVYQGAFGLIEDVEMVAIDPKTIRNHIFEEAQWLQDNREEISQDVSAIENLIDDLCAMYLRTHYKLKNLE